MILGAGSLLLPSAVAAVAYALAAAPQSSAANVHRPALIVGWVAHAIALVVDIGGVGIDVSAARFGFAPALSVTLWLVVAVYGVESRFVPLPAAARRALALSALAAVALAAVFPGEVRTHADAAWAPLHWLLGLASYGLFGAAVLHAGLLDAQERRMRLKVAAGPPAGMPLLQLERVTFRFVSAGFLLLSAAIVLAFGFAPQWRWDHKAVFSVLGWGVFALLLGGRQAFGWRGRRATRWLYAGAVLLLLAYVGSRFVLEVILHRPPAAT